MAFTESFTYNVLLVSIIIFLIALIYVGLSIYFNWNYTEKEPPTVNACPDYWEIDSNGYCVMPTTRNIGTLTSGDPYLKANKINPNDRIWSKFGSPICAQRTWARSHNIEWEGVSNYNKC
jgi:hypothetical protein